MGCNASMVSAALLPASIHPAVRFGGRGLVRRGGRATLHDDVDGGSEGSGMVGGEPWPRTMSPFFFFAATSSVRIDGIYREGKGPLSELDCTDSRRESSNGLSMYV